MKYTKLFLILLLAVGVSSSCSKIKESPDPSTLDGANSGGGSGGGGGNSGDPDVYLGLWRMTEKTLAGASIFGDSDTTYEVKLDAASTATWNFYVGANIVRTEPDIYVLDKNASPVTINFTKKEFGLKEIVNKTGSEMVWTYADHRYNNQMVVETYQKQ